VDVVDIIHLIVVDVDVDEIVLVVDVDVDEIMLVVDVDVDEIVLVVNVCLRKPRDCEIFV